MRVTEASRMSGAEVASHDTVAPEAAASPTNTPEVTLRRVPPVVTIGASGSPPAGAVTSAVRYSRVTLMSPLPRPDRLFQVSATRFSGSLKTGPSTVTVVYWG